MSTTTDFFRQLGLSDEILQGLEAVGYETPSPIQAACIPLLLSGDDVLGQAQTGTGKTAAFALPILNKLDLKRKVTMGPQALVLTPTRELAIQVAEAFQTYAKFIPGFHVLPVYGGQSMVLQLRQLQRGVHVIVGTPGRIMDHLERKSLRLDSLTTMVLDEADEMLRMGFIDDVEWILKHTPAERQTALFSATMPDVIRRVAGQYMRTPKEIKIKTATSTAINIRQRYWLTTGLNKIDALSRILEAEPELDAAIVFVRTKIETAMVAEKLEARGYAAAALSGDLAQAMRERVIDQLKSGKLDIVIATDVAARGLDVPRISHVINYDIPNDTESYVHRIGRTGRAGRAGEAILFVSPRERHLLRAIERATRQPIEAMALPSIETVANRRVEQFKEQVVLASDEKDMRFYQGIVEQLMQEQSIPAEELAAILLYMAQKDKPLELSPEEMREPRGHSSSSDRDGGRYGQDSRRPYDRNERGGSRDDRPSRGRDSGRDGGRSEREPRDFSRGGGDTTRYRVAVGLQHEISAKHIVGALANEGGMDIAAIGSIRLFDDFSTVELPTLTPGQQDRIGRIRVRQHPLMLKPDDGTTPAFRADVKRAGGDRPASFTATKKPRKPKFDV